MSTKTITIISGPQGSGKSTLAKSLSNHLTVQAIQTEKGLVSIGIANYVNFFKGLPVWVDECTDPVEATKLIHQGNFSSGIICTTKPIKRFRKDLPDGSYRLIQLEILFTDTTA